MRKFYAVLLLFAALDYTPAFSQLRYDDGPILTGVSTNFVTVRSWGRNNITYSFVNGTNDMPANDAQQAVRQAFQIWADYANLNFTEVATNGDIRISWGAGDHGDGVDKAFDGTNGVLAHAYFPPPNGGDIAGDMHFDEDESWTTAAQAFPWQPIDLVTVAAHEIGHALGLNHSDVNCALMNPFYNGSHRYLAPDDIDGIRSLYGGRSPLNRSGLNCAGGTLFVNNLPDGATVTYQSSNTSIATINTVNNQGIVTPVSGAAGPVQFTATITLPCGITWSDVVEVGIGAPGLLSATITSGATSGFLMQCNTLSVLYAPGEYMGTVNVYDQVSTTLNWTFEGKSSNAAVYFDASNPRNVTVRVKGLNAWASYRLTRINACGSTWSIHTFRANYACPTEARKEVNEEDPTITLSPNPAVNQVTIAIKKNNAVITAPDNDENEKITAVKIYDMMGRLRKLQRYNKAGTVTINVSDLLSGIYFVEIFNGSTNIKRNLQIIR
jgi:predicted Zn-dependent protease